MKAIVDNIPGFRLLDVLGQGAQGVVCRVRELATGREVALKLCRQGLLATDTERKRFEQEIRNHARLDHPNIVRVLESGNSGGYGWFTTDFVNGLALDRWQELSDTLIDDNAGWNLAVFIKICSAIEYLHGAGIIHRDLKPSNILVDERNEPHVLDFGLARVTESSCASTLTAPGATVGTIQYSAPEQLLGIKVDERSDIYALGVMLYDWVVQCYPYDCDPNDREEVVRHILSKPPIRPRSRYPGISQTLESIILKCIAKEPSRRYQRVADLRKDLRDFMDGRPVKVQRPSMAFLATNIIKRHRGIIAATAVAFAAVITNFSSGNRGQQTPIDNRPVFGTAALLEYDGSPVDFLEVVESHRIRPDFKLHPGTVPPKPFAVGSNETFQLVEKLGDAARASSRDGLFDYAFRIVDACTSLSDDLAQSDVAPFTGTSLVIDRNSLETLEFMTGLDAPREDILVRLDNLGTFPAVDHAVRRHRLQIRTFVRHISDGNGQLDWEKMVEYDSGYEQLPAEFILPTTAETEAFVDTMFNAWLEAARADRPFVYSDFDGIPAYEIIKPRLANYNAWMHMRSNLKEIRERLYERLAV